MFQTFERQAEGDEKQGRQPLRPGVASRITTKTSVPRKGPCRGARSRVPMTTVTASEISGEAIDIARDGSGSSRSMCRLSRPLIHSPIIRPTPSSRSARCAPARSRRLQISNSSSSSSLTTTAQPLRRARPEARRGSRRGADVDAPGRLRDVDPACPTMNFCRLPPERLRRRARPAGPEDWRSSARRRRRRPGSSPSACQQRVLRQRQGRHANGRGAAIRN